MALNPSGFGSQGGGGGGSGATGPAGPASAYVVGGLVSAAAAGERFGHFFTAGVSSLETQRQVVWPHAGSFASFSVGVVTLQQGSDSALTISIRKNRTTSGLTIVIPAATPAPSIISDLSDTFSVDANDTVSIRFDTSATTQASNVQFTAKFTPS